ncbi:exodeoxyribonuclease VII large subunit [Candidatus Saccharibacteria bacterium]|nr:exodeoxyribonuclease VII large subunit [Candidatus Saccharibacteria bacterium]
MSPDAKLTVSEFVQIANETFQFTFPEIFIEGEVNSFKVNQSKFVFFDLRDSESTVSCFMMLFQMRFPLENGMRVVVRATPKITNWGKFSLTVSQISPVGQGSIKKSLDLLRTKLSTEGIFANKRPLPEVISKIAVISSKDAAGYHDFIKILSERWSDLQIDLAHVQVQGFTAPDQIVRALHYFNEKSSHDIIAIIRGGGSADDLAPFNDEVLARAIAASKIPTVTGIGHEVDETLADLAADIRTSTPSNAAQLITPDKNTAISQIYSDLTHTRTYLLDQITYVSQDLRTEISTLSTHLHHQIDRRLAEVTSLRSLAEQLDPETVLARGYATITGSPTLGQIVNITTSKNFIQAEVKNVKKRNT